MNLEINQIPTSDYRFIPVASQLLDGKPLSDYKTISCGSEVWEITDHFTYQKGEFMPMGFLKLVIGQDIEMETIWRKYPTSTSLIVFVGKLIESNLGGGPLGIALKTIKG